jgi:hypothetical protein
MSDEEKKEDRSKEKLAEMVGDLKGLLSRVEGSLERLRKTKARCAPIVDGVKRGDGPPMAGTQDAHSSRLEAKIDTIVDLMDAIMDAQITTLDLGRIQLGQGLGGLEEVLPPNAEA